MAFRLGGQTMLNTEMLLWLRNGERMKELVNLLISAFPRIEYTKGLHDPGYHHGPCG